MGFLTGLGFIYLWASISVLYLGVHSYTLSQTAPNLGPDGPPQNVEIMLGVDVSYIPRHNDWPNVVEPELQYWPVRNEW